MWNKGFYILERKIKRKRLKIRKRVKKKIYENVMIHSIWNIKRCVWPRRLGPEWPRVNMFLSGPPDSFQCHRHTIIYLIWSSSQVSWIFPLCQLVWRQDSSGSLWGDMKKNAILLGRQQKLPRRTFDKNLKERNSYLFCEYDQCSHGIAITEGSLD